MLEFFDLYGSHQRCEEAIRLWRWPEGFVCPRCQGNWHSEFRRQERLYFQCSGCRYQCSVLSGTIFESSKLALPKWFLVMHLMTQAKNNVSALELKRHLGVSYPTAWLVKHKLMEVMFLREADRKLTGRIEADDAYLGGERPGGKPGRGSENKVPFVAAVQTTESGQAVLLCLSRRPFTKHSIQEFSERSLAAPATLVTDGLGCFTAVRGRGILHEQHVTGGGAACAKHPSFLAVNTALGNLRISANVTAHFGHRDRRRGRAS
jgi:transposase-like protein